MTFYTYWPAKKTISFLLQFVQDWVHICHRLPGLYVDNFSSFVLHIPHNSFPYQKSWWKVKVNVVTPQELKMVFGELNEINGEKLFCIFER